MSRVLVIGLASYWGGRLAQALEGFEQVEAIIGVDAADPTMELERTEFVRVSNQHGLIQRIVRAAEIDTVIDARLTVNSMAASPRATHENNVIGTMNILAACTGSGLAGAEVHLQELHPLLRVRAGRPGVLHRVDAASARPPYGARARHRRGRRGGSRLRAQERADVEVTVLRCANVLGPDVDTAFTRMLSLPVVPMVLGFDPRIQFVHEDDVVHALEHAARQLGPGRLQRRRRRGPRALARRSGCSASWPLPILPPFGTGLAAGPLRRLGLRIPNEMWNQLRFGRGVDNRAYKANGFHYGYTTREAVQRYGEHLRLRPVMRGQDSDYTYEREVEEFLRWSPHARRERDGAAADREPLGI